MEQPDGVVVEQSLHEGMREVAQRIFDEFEIKISSVQFMWRYSPGNRQRLVVDSVQIESMTQTEKDQSETENRQSPRGR
jgi:hypothetical protein